MISAAQCLQAIAGDYTSNGLFYCLLPTIGNLRATRSRIITSQNNAPAQMTLAQCHSPALNQRSKAREHQKIWPGVMF